MQMKKKLITTVIIVIALLMGIQWVQHHHSDTVAKEIPVVCTQTVKLAGDTQEFTYSGEVVGRYQSQMSFQTGGKIISRNVEAGSEVKKGDLLMKVDPQDVEQSVKSAQSQMAAAQSQFDFATDTLKRYQKLYEGEAIGKAQLDSVQTSYDLAKSALNQASAQYEGAMNQLGYTGLYADSSGVITAIYAEEGQVVAPGQPILTIVQNDEREIEISIPENRVKQLREAEKIQATFWALPDITLGGTVREIVPMADPVTRTYKAHISLDSVPKELELGMTTTISVSSPAEQIGYVEIPTSAIYQTGSVPQVWMVKNNVLHLKDVEVGDFDGDNIQVTKGLTSGDVIVTAGVHKLSKGLKVKTTGDIQ